MTPEQVFMYAKSYKLYFTTNSYDFLKYQGHTKTPPLISQRDRQFYYRLSVKLNDEEIHAAFLLAHFYKPTTYIADICASESLSAAVSFAARAENGVRQLAHDLYDLRKRLRVEDLHDWLYAPEDASIPHAIEALVAKELPVDLACLLLLIPQPSCGLQWTAYWEQREPTHTSFGVRPWLERLRKADQLLYWRRPQWRQHTHALAERFWSSYEHWLTPAHRDVQLF